jgi:hypothetical protein
MRVRLKGDSGAIFRMNEKCTTKPTEGTTLYNTKNVYDGWLSEAWFLSYNLLMIKELLKVSILSLIAGCCTS